MSDGVSGGGNCPGDRFRVVNGFRTVHHGRRSSDGHAAGDVADTVATVAVVLVVHVTTQDGLVERAEASLFG